MSVRRHLLFSDTVLVMRVGVNGYKGREEKEIHPVLTGSGSWPRQETRSWKTTHTEGAVTALAKCFLSLTLLDFILNLSRNAAEPFRRSRTPPFRLAKQCLYPWVQFLWHSWHTFFSSGYFHTSVSSSPGMPWGHR